MSVAAVTGVNMIMACIAAGIKSAMLTSVDTVKAGATGMTIAGAVNTDITINKC